MYNIYYTYTHTYIYMWLGWISSEKEIQCPNRSQFEVVNFLALGWPPSQ